MYLSNQRLWTLSMAVFILTFKYNDCIAQKRSCCHNLLEKYFYKIFLQKFPCSSWKEKISSHQALRIRCQWYRIEDSGFICWLWTGKALKALGSSPWKMCLPLILSLMIGSQCQRFVNGFQNVQVAPPIASCLHFFITTCILLVNHCKINSPSQMFLFSLTAQQ